MPIQEIENNNDLAQALVTNLDNESVDIAGNMGNVDTLDNFSFRTQSSINFSADLTGLISNRNVDLFLYEDLNLDNMAQDNELIAQSTNSGNSNESISRRLDANKNYIVRTDFVTAAGTTGYNLKLEGRQVAKEISVNFASAEKIGDFGDEPDFFGKVTIGDGPTQSTRTINNNNNPFFDESFSRFIPEGSFEIVPIKIELIDSDSGLFNDDDRADISPQSGVKDLEVLYNTTTGTFSGRPGSGIPLTKEGVEITLKGNGDNNQAAAVTFSVNHVEI